MAVLNFIQAQKFVISGSGTAIGDTTIILQSMVGIDAANIVTADLGTKAYGTLEPGNGTQEEAISFTGVTQNANGTATLTGVKTCLFKSPYTETSGLAKTHAGASTFILSNDAGFYNNIMTYVNTSLSSGAVPATTSVNGIVTLSATPATGATPVVLAVDDSRVSYIPSTTQKDALAGGGIQGTQSSGNVFVTQTGLVTSLATGTIMEIIGDTTLGADNATISVSSLAVHKDLTIVLDVKGKDGAGGTAQIRFNADAGSNYGYTYLAFISANTFSYNTANAATSIQAQGAAVNATPELWNLNVSINAAAVKLVSGALVCSSATATNAPQYLVQVYGTWNNTADSITAISVTLTGQKYLAGTRLTVYGSK